MLYFILYFVGWKCRRLLSIKLTTVVDPLIRRKFRLEAILYCTCGWEPDRRTPWRRPDDATPNCEFVCPFVSILEEEECKRRAQKKSAKEECKRGQVS